jgi:hypothetical protein
MFQIPRYFLSSMFHIPSCFISLHVSHPFMFYLSACFTILHDLTLYMFHIPPNFISLHISDSFMFYLFACFTILHVLRNFQRVSDPSIFYLCMLQIPSCFIFQHVSDPSIFYLSACFTPLQAVGDWRFPCRPVLRCSRFDALLEIHVSIIVILNVKPSSYVDSYQRFERTQYLTFTLKMAAARFSETLAHLSVHVFRLSRLVLITGQSSGF